MQMLLSSVTLELGNWNELSNVLFRIHLFYWLIGYHLIFVKWLLCSLHDSLHLLSAIGQNPAMPDNKFPAIFCPRTKFNPGQKIAWQTCISHVNVIYVRQTSFISLHITYTIESWQIMSFFLFQILLVRRLNLCKLKYKSLYFHVMAAYRIRKGCYWAPTVLDNAHMPLHYCCLVLVCPNYSWPCRWDCSKKIEARLAVRLWFGKFPPFSPMINFWFYALTNLFSFSQYEYFESIDIFFNHNYGAQYNISVAFLNLFRTNSI